MLLSKVPQPHGQEARSVGARRSTSDKNRAFLDNLTLVDHFRWCVIR
jgi:hypothetical protein